MATSERLEEVHLLERRRVGVLWQISWGNFAPHGGHWRVMSRLRYCCLGEKGRLFPARCETGVDKLRPHSFKSNERLKSKSRKSIQRSKMRLLIGQTASIVDSQ